jgi:hypothetical protein
MLHTSTELCVAKERCCKPWLNVNTDNNTLLLSVQHDDDATQALCVVVCAGLTFCSCTAAASALSLLRVQTPCTTACSLAAAASRLSWYCCHHCCSNSSRRAHKCCSKRPDLHLSHDIAINRDAVWRRLMQLRSHHFSRRCAHLRVHGMNARAMVTTTVALCYQS